MLLFERKNNVKESLNIGRKAFIEKKVNNLLGKATSDNIDEVLEIFMNKIYSTCSVYMDPGSYEEERLYWIYRLLGLDAFKALHVYSSYQKTDFSLLESDYEDREFSLKKKIKLEMEYWEAHDFSHYKTKIFGEFVFAEVLMVNYNLPIKNLDK